MTTVQPVALSVQNISKAFGTKKALQNISFEIQAGSITSVLGPSGCGKSTLLALIAGLETPDQGSILWENQSLEGIPPHLRGFGLMFQDYALFPHLNVFDNVAFGLRMAQQSTQAVKRRVTEVLELVGMNGYDKRDINTLSGGEAQRVALARALAPQPRLLMLDEPLGSLDRSLRERLTGELRTILRMLALTTLYVTHDQEEAFLLSDEVIILNAGEIVQTGKPQEIYQKPKNIFVAKFLGLGNLLPATAHGEYAETAIGKLPLPEPRQGEIIILLRPESMRLSDEGPHTLEGEVVERTFLGTACRAVIEVHGIRLTFDFPPQACVPEPRQTARVSFTAHEAIQVFPAEELKNQSIT
jgi:ABC-type Fe3+/spermidine/putrescine transport system ATPase subunit